MKVGIITFHFAHNYGAMIQAYALQNKISSMGHDTYIVDYRPSYHTRHFSPGINVAQIWTFNPIRLIKNIVKYVLFQPIQNKRYDAFEHFLKYHLRLFPYNPTSVFSEFDVIVLGSDQIWDLNHTNYVFDGPYFGEFFRCRVVSYAASSKMKTLTKDQEEGFKERLKNLYMISVRETSLKNLLQPLSSKPIYVNLDPTLLVDKSAYDRLNLSRPIKERYVLIYELYELKEVRRMAEMYAKYHNARVISLVAFFDWKKRSSRYDQVASPEQFLAYIKNAECIFTTSFHGTALSIVFHKPFYTIKRNTVSDLRMQSLLSQLGLLSQFVEKTEKVYNCNIDYSGIQSRLDNLRRESDDYLKKAMKF